MSKRSAKVIPKKEEQVEKPAPEGPKAEAPPLESPTSTPEPTPPQPPSIQPLTLQTLSTDLQTLQKLVLDHAQQIAQLQEALSRKRRPPKSNGKVQIRDKKTDKVYRSKNNAYQSLLKAGDLKELVGKGLFGDVPEKNTFGWYVLVREWPDRFEEVKAEEEKVADSTQWRWTISKTMYLPGSSSIGPAASSAS
jgi:hypothetical protein